MQKRCPSCRITQPSTEFSPDRSKADGLNSKCKTCDRARAKAYYARNRVATIARQSATNAVLRLAAIRIYGGSCVECGGADALQFDHIHGDGGAHRRRESHKSMIVRIVAAGTPLTDIKLQLLCLPCHQKKTSRDAMRSRAA